MTLRTWLIVALFTVAALPARAQDSFSDHYDRAVAFAQNDQHAEALKELQAAYAIRQLPKLLYEIARAQHRLGNAKEAAEHYQRYLVADSNPDPAMRADAEAQIVALRRFMPAPPQADLRYRLDSPDIKLAPVRYEMRSHRGMLGWGISLLSVGYAAAFMSGVTFAIVGGGSSSNDPSGNLAAAGGTLIIPVIGPFISSLVFRNAAWSVPWALIDGAAQVTGLALTIVGARTKRKVAVLADRFKIGPYATPDGGGLTVSGKF